MTPSPESSGKCERRGEALAWLQGELPPDRAEDYGEHLEECAACAEFVADAREMLERLHDESVNARDGNVSTSTRTRTVRSGARALTDTERRILLHCAPDLAALQVQARGRARRGALAAAAVLLVTVSAHLTLRAVRGDDTPPAALVMAEAPMLAAPEASADWIADRLGPDGRFDVASWSGPRAEEVAMHGLALLALARADGADDDEAARRDDVLRGARWLLDQQGADGTVGATIEGGGFDHAVATVALLEASARTHDATVTSGAERAISRLVASQLADGGWQPHAHARGCNPVSTAWALQALLRADQCDVPGLQEPIARGQARLASDLGDTREPAALDLAAVSLIALATPGDAVPAGPASRAPSSVPGPDAGRAVAAAGRTLGDLYAASVVVLAAMPTPR